MVWDAELYSTQFGAPSVEGEPTKVHGMRMIHVGIVSATPQESTLGALIIRIGFWGPLYYTYNKEPPQ